MNTSDTNLLGEGGPGVEDSAGEKMGGGGREQPLIGEGDSAAADYRAVVRRTLSTNVYTAGKVDA